MDNASLAKAAIDNTSLATLAQQSSTYLVWISLPPISILANVLVVLTVVLSKEELHNKPHFIIVSHALAEVTYSLAHFGTGLSRYTSYVDHTPYTANQLVCIFRQIPIVLGTSITQIFPAALAFDRLICIGSPINYSKLKLKMYVERVNCVCWTYSFLTVSFMFIDYDINKLIPVCSTLQATSPRVSQATNPIGNVLIGTTTFAYLAAAAVMYIKYKKANLVGDIQKNEWRRKVDFNVSITMSVIGLLYIITALFPFAIRSITIYSSFLSNATNTGLILTSIYFSSGISHLFVYLAVNRRFRENFLRVMCRRKANQTDVIPMV